MEEQDNTGSAEFPIPVAEVELLGLAFTEVCGACGVPPVLLSAQGERTRDPDAIAAARRALESVLLGTAAPADEDGERAARLRAVLQRDALAGDDLADALRAAWSTGVDATALPELLGMGDVEERPVAVLPGLAWAGALAITSGGAKHGKSTFLSGALAAPAGSLFCGRMVPAIAGEVVVLSEMGRGRMGRYLRDAAWNPAERPIRVCTMRTVDSVVGMIRQHTPALVIVDSLLSLLVASGLRQGGAWDPTVVGRSLRGLQAAAVETGTAVSILHHTRKNDATPADSREILAAADMLASFNGLEDDGKTTRGDTIPGTPKRRLEYEHERRPVPVQGAVAPRGGRHDAVQAVSGVRPVDRGAGRDSTRGGGRLRSGGAGGEAGGTADGHVDAAGSARVHVDSGGGCTATLAPRTSLARAGSVPHVADDQPRGAPFQTGGSLAALTFPAGAVVNARRAGPGASSTWRYRPTGGRGPSYRCRVKPG